MDSGAETPLDSRRDDRRCTEEPAHCIRVCKLDSWLLVASSCKTVEKYDSGPSGMHCHGCLAKTVRRLYVDEPCNGVCIARVVPS